jgi:hypothetical protein
VGGDEVAASEALPGEQSIRFEVRDAASEIRFVFTPDGENPGAAVLRKFSSARGFVINFR